MRRYSIGTDAAFGRSDRSFEFEKLEELMGLVTYTTVMLRWWMLRKLLDLR